MKRIINYLVLLIFISCNIAIGQGISNFDDELDRIKTDTALIVPSQEIDEYPLWSPTSDYIAANINYNWYKVNLNKVKLEKANWRGNQTIGLIQSQSFLEEMQEKEVLQFKKVSKLNIRKVKTKKGEQIELKTKGLGTALIITEKWSFPKTLWVTEMENCHSLVLSPNQKYVAFLCELSGLVILKL